MNRLDAIAANSKHYIGKVCDLHPELKGQRRTKSRLCVQCKRAYNQARAERNRDEYRARMREAAARHQAKKKNAPGPGGPRAR